MQPNNNTPPVSSNNIPSVLGKRSHSDFAVPHPKLPATNLPASIRVTSPSNTCPQCQRVVEENNKLKAELKVLSEKIAELANIAGVISTLGGIGPTQTDVNPVLVEEPRLVEEPSAKTLTEKQKKTRELNLFIFNLILTEKMKGVRISKDTAQKLLEEKGPSIKKTTPSSVQNKLALSRMILELIPEKINSSATPAKIKTIFEELLPSNTLTLQKSPVKDFSVSYYKTINHHYHSVRCDIFKEDSLFVKEYIPYLSNRNKD